MQENKINIAIDGYSGCGKSSTAKALAKSLNYTYIDTGAMYRAVTLYFLEQKIDINDPQAVSRALQEIDIKFLPVDGGDHTFLNGKDVEHEIRSARVSQMVSPVSTISAVRKALVRQQRQMGIKKGVVMDGRDIGTVVFPDAELKIFMTAEPDVRAKRRMKQLAGKGIDESEVSIKANLLERDKIDSSRSDSPLKKADDAIEIDTTDITLQEQLQIALQHARKAIG